MINMHAMFLHPAAARKPSNKYYLFILIVCLVKVLQYFLSLKSSMNVFYHEAQHFYSNLQL